MSFPTERLDVRRKFADAAADWLARRAEDDPSGAKSLAHVLVVVPTAQSGRRLRLKLAERFGALVPPEIRLPQQLLAGTPDEALQPSRSDELLAFLEALGEGGTLDVAAQFADIRGLLGTNALSFADVAARIGDVLTDETADFEIERWQGFAEMERRYRDALARRGKRDRIETTKATIAEPPPLLGIEKIVLVCLLDPHPALERLLERYRTRDGLEVTELMPDLDEAPLACPLASIVPCATAASEAEKAADLFAGVRSDEALPALCVADPEAFPEIQGALQAKGLKVHDPSRMPLVTSSLGHLVEQVAALMRTRSYNVFSAFVRSGDVRRWLCADLRITSEEYVAALVQLDNAQAKLLPEKIDDIGPKTKGKLRAVFERIDALLRKRDLRYILQQVFREHLLDERDPDAREFAAAAETVNALIDECFSSPIPHPSSLLWELFAMRLREAAYSLEPDEGDVILTDGWLELPFAEADELVVTGFNEGRVPESVVGHAFLPDRLRRGLGLPDNESRTQRDRAYLRMALACRAPSAVRISFRAIDAQGDVLKPSRLLFEGTDDAGLVARVNRFYGLRAGTEEAKTADLPPGWRLKLEIPPERKPLEFT